MRQRVKIGVGIGIMLLVLLMPLTAYCADLNSDLRSAAEQGDIATVEALLAKGADVNAKDKDGQTALILAAQKGHTEIAEALLAKGADADAKNKYGKTALMYAKLRKQKEETSRRIAEKLRSTKIKAVVMDVRRVALGREFELVDVRRFDPSDREEQIVARIVQMGLWSPEPQGLTLHISIDISYWAETAAIMFSHGREGPLVEKPSIRSMTLSDGRVTYSLADCQDLLATRLADEVQEVIDIEKHRLKQYEWGIFP